MIDAGILPANNKHKEELLRVQYCTERKTNPDVDLGLFVLASALRLPQVAKQVYQLLKTTFKTPICDQQFVDKGVRYDLIAVACVAQNLDLLQHVLIDHQHFLTAFSNRSALAMCIEMDWVEGARCLMNAGAAISSSESEASDEATLAETFNVFTVAMRNCSLISIPFLLEYLHKRGISKEALLSAMCDFPRIVRVMQCTFTDDRAQARPLLQLMAKELFAGDNKGFFIRALDGLVVALHQFILSHVKDFVQDLYTLEEYEAAGAENIVYELTH